MQHATSPRTGNSTCARSEAGNSPSQSIGIEWVGQVGPGSRSRPIEVLLWHYAKGKPKEEVAVDLTAATAAVVIDL